MKTKTLFLLCLLIGIPFAKLSSQDKQETKPNYSEVSVYEYSDWQPVYCNGEMVDELTGTLTVHTVDHVKNGVWTSLVSHMSGESTSNYTGEIFKVSDAVAGFPPLSLDTWHFNLIGNYGTHYVGSMKYYYGNWEDPSDDILYVDKAVCLDNKKR